MLALYLIALLIGGVLVAVSAFAGGHSDADVDFDLDADADLDVDGDMDADADADADADGDHDGDHGHGGALSGLGSFLPILSLRFWTFFLAFGGLTGTLLSVLGLLGTVGTAIAAVGVGYVAGLGITAAVRQLKKDQISSTVDEHDAIGTTATVLLPVSRAARGRVRVLVRGRALDLVAETEDPDALAIASEVLVYEVREDGTAMVTAEREDAA